MAVSSDSEGPEGPMLDVRAGPACACPRATARAYCPSARTPDRRCVYSTDAPEYMRIARRGMQPEQARAWIRRCTQDTRAWGPDYLD